MLTTHFREASTLWREKPGKYAKKNSAAYQFFNTKLQPEIEKIVRHLGYKALIVDAEVGNGSWSKTPYIAIRHNGVAPSFMEGVSVAYLFAPDFGRLYITIIQGVKRTRSTELDKSKKKLEKTIDRPEGFNEGPIPQLVRDEKPNSSSAKYRKGIIYSKEYILEKLPDDEEFTNDLKKTLKIYQDYAESQ